MLYLYQVQRNKKARLIVLVSCLLNSSYSVVAPLWGYFCELFMNFKRFVRVSNELRFFKIWQY